MTDDPRQAARADRPLDAVAPAHGSEGQTLRSPDIELISLRAARALAGAVPAR